MSKMNETELTMPMKFDETNFCIISPNPTVSTKIIVSMTSFLYGMIYLQISHMAIIHVELDAMDQ